MSTGPCLCGDPYCPSCGDPHRAVLEAAEENLMETLYNLKADEFFYQFLIEAIPGMLQAFQKANADAVNEARSDLGMEMNHLESEIAILRDRLGE